MARFFAYGEQELAHLAGADERFTRLIAHYEKRGIRPERPVEEDVFCALMRTINDQLISLKAATSIWSRLIAAFGDPPTPGALAAATPGQIQACGTTWRKAEYMHDIALLVQEGELDLEAMRAWDDAAVIARFTALRGLGLWSAEMLLIHAYERPDVISFGDAGIRRGLCMLYGLDAADLSKARFEELTRPYHPYATVASIYLWHLSAESGQERFVCAE